MAEDPTKLFATHAERYPQSNEIDATRTALEKVVEMVPVLGPITVHMIAHFLAPGVERRREEWFKELADGLDRLRETKECFNVESLAQSETFVSAAIQATRIAIATHQEEKRAYLRNALLNIAIGKGPGEIKQQIFLNAIEAFSPAHVRALDLMWRGPSLRVPWDEHSIGMRLRNYGTALGLLVPEVGGQTSLLIAIFADLRIRGLSSLSGPEQTFPQGGIITNLGIEFMNFVLSPEDIPR